MPENPYQPPKDDGRQKYFWWRLSDPWWSLAVALTICAVWVGIGAAMYLALIYIAPTLGPRAD
jgi:hypothetical protein